MCGTSAHMVPSFLPFQPVLSVNMCVFVFKEMKPDNIHLSHHIKENTFFTIKYVLCAAGRQHLRYKITYFNCFPLMAIKYSTLFAASSEISVHFHHLIC